MEADPCLHDHRPLTPGLTREDSDLNTRGWKESKRETGGVGVEGDEEQESRLGTRPCPGTRVVPAASAPETGPRVRRPRTAFSGRDAKLWALARAPGVVQGQQGRPAEVGRPFLWSAKPRETSLVSVSDRKDEPKRTPLSCFCFIFLGFCLGC